MTDAFEKIINKIPKTASVLDVGAWGHEGVNTSISLRKRFNDVTGINTKYNDAVDIVADFYEYTLTKRFDLIVLDLNIDNNVKRDWTDEGLKRIHEMLSRNGVVVIYIETDLNYGNEVPGIREKLIKHKKDFWGLGESQEFTKERIKKGLGKYKKMYNVFAIEPEQRRIDIIWIALKKTNGF